MVPDILLMSLRSWNSLNPQQQEWLQKAVEDSVAHQRILWQEATMLALKEDMIGMSMTNASPLVAPTFSTDRLLGTNPIAVAIPAENEPPFVADFATTTAANGKLEILQHLRPNLCYRSSYPICIDRCT